MKDFSYQLSDGDIYSLVALLTILPNVKLDYVSDVQQSINDTCCMSAIEKLQHKCTNFTPNEIRIMYVALAVADSILKGNIIVDSKLKQCCTEHLFTINHLLSIFDKSIG